MLISFTGLLACVTKASDRAKCISLNKGPGLARLSLIDLNSKEFHYYPFMVSLGKSNALDDLSSRIYILNKQEI